MAGVWERLKDRSQVARPREITKSEELERQFRPRIGFLDALLFWRKDLLLRRAVSVQNATLIEEWMSRKQRNVSTSLRQLRSEISVALYRLQRLLGALKAPVPPLCSC